MDTKEYSNRRFVTGEHKMKLITKFICSALAVLLLLSTLFSCGNFSEDEKSSEDTSDTVNVENSEDSNGATEETEPEETDPEETDPEETEPEETEPEETEPEETEPEETETEREVNEADDIAPDKFNGASEGYEKVF